MRKNNEIFKNKTYKDIKSSKEDNLDQLNNLEELYWMYLTELVYRRMDSWILSTGGLIGY